MSTKPYSPVKKDETEAVAHDEKEAEDKEEEEKEEEKVENLDPQQQLYYYCRRADIDGIKEVQNSVDINGKDDTGSKTQPYISGNTALHYAVLSGSIETVKVVFNLAATLSIKNKLGSTPLHLAAALGYTEIVRFLIDMKADMEATNKIQNTPLHCAVYAGHVDTVKVILDNCDDPRQSLLLPVNGIGFGAVKYTAHDEMKKYLRANYFPKDNKKGDDGQANNLQNGNDVEEEEIQPPPSYEGPNGSQKNNTSTDVQEEEDAADETTGLTTGTPATATEQ
mmetsp:Transcript_46488/g.41538  ORF Transcript_46488/g.41538 Transcript_46488/m.41538 type:complete len:280 (-) Transcript_46488:292-1131(-)|eukprot:CAMPEP_0201592750 /NCGR_PEP_ID=MMETSP0190_2-20130828/190557_1 /ASSEMBLY_ACC=CAM_ASM_000263 /TAXON_ID=37353 /ORGANISM="Rosalina sp." /LENGTH=279 /DNA_ID=CAMNT_0048051659 /DNA_START=240 /DNA_END=1079 /DNA_ORIENTATION=-